MKIVRGRNEKQVLPSLIRMYIIIATGDIGA